MSAQRYTSDVACQRMRVGTCPECGTTSRAHSSDSRFWIPRTCDLTKAGVEDRITQFWADQDGPS